MGKELRNPGVHLDISFSSYYFLPPYLKEISIGFLLGNRHATEPLPGIFIMHQPVVSQRIGSLSGDPTLMHFFYMTVTKPGNFVPNSFYACRTRFVQFSVGYTFQDHSPCPKYFPLKFP